MKTLEESVKEQLNKELDRWFPSKKKQSARGSAVTLTGAFIIELRKVITAFGGCEYCYGKGYATVLVGTQGFADFVPGEGFVETPTNRVAFCICSRGKDLKRLWKSAKTV